MFHRTSSSRGNADAIYILQCSGSVRGMHAHVQVRCSVLNMLLTACMTACGLCGGYANPLVCVRHDIVKRMQLMSAYQRRTHVNYQYGGELTRSYRSKVCRRAATAASLLLRDMAIQAGADHGKRVYTHKSLHAPVHTRSQPHPANPRKIMKGLLGDRLLYLVMQPCIMYAIMKMLA